MKPFRFAVQASKAVDGPAWRELCRRVEGLGYSTLNVADHLGGQWGPLVALTAAAAATRTLTVASMVFNNDLRHPVVLAKEAATLDLLSEGRFEFGLGAGWLTDDYTAAGLRQDRPGARVERLGEALHIVRTLWTDGACRFTGTHYNVDATAAPAPFSRPYPKICVGGGGRRVLALAARTADIVGVNASLAAGTVGRKVALSALAARFDERLIWVRAAAGARFDDLELQCYASDTVVTDDRSSALARLTGALGLTVEQAADCPLLLIGTVDEICSQLTAHRERWGLSYWVVYVDAVDDFAPVVARLAGT
ncbi:TIGR03621 family F420-dependent LLM class oxidoreductase [Krasilnikovia sp. M28-CT-15]|uniref:TIGR03621 family F420-dependent LLM class oxidoreductase n=1 Tax=Krasilnikovia sp. M28-CT-15 TaxID=3373540 RepID=UPI0038768644